MGGVFYPCSTPALPHPFLSFFRLLFPSVLDVFCSFRACVFLVLASLGHMGANIILQKSMKKHGGNLVKRGSMGG